MTKEEKLRVKRYNQIKKLFDILVKFGYLKNEKVYENIYKTIRNEPSVEFFLNKPIYSHDDQIIGSMRIITKTDKLYTESDIFYGTITDITVTSYDLGKLERVKIDLNKLNKLKYLNIDKLEDLNIRIQVGEGGYGKTNKLFYRITRY